MNPYATGTPATQDQLTQLYQQYFGRAPDPSGFQFWMDSGFSPEQIAQQFQQSPEYKSSNQTPDWLSAIYSSPTTTYSGTPQQTTPPQQATPPTTTASQTDGSTFTPNPPTPQITQGYTPYQGGNPYLAQQAQNMTALSNQNLMQNIMPQINSGAVATGNYGSSRQGVAQGVAAGNAQTGLNAAISNLYSQGYQTDQALANQYNIANGNLGFNYANLDRQINNDNVYNQIAGANLGLNAYNTLMNGNQAGITAGTNIQNTPLQYFGQFANIANGIGNGYGTSTSTSTAQGNPYLGFMGGAMLGGQLYKNLGF